MAKLLTELRQPNDPDHLPDHAYIARLLNELYGLASYGSVAAPLAAGATVHPDPAAGGVHLLYPPAGGNVVIGPAQSSDADGVLAQFSQGQRLSVYVAQPAAGGATVTWDASWAGFQLPAHTAGGQWTWAEFVNTAVSGAAPAWMLLSTNATSASGLIAARPAAGAVPAGFLYFATDDGPGTTYRSNGAAWTAIATAGGGSGTELAYVESSTPFNVRDAIGVGNAPAYVDVPGMSLVVPAGQAFYLELGYMASFNTNGSSTAGQYGVAARAVDLAATGVAVASAQHAIPVTATGAVNASVGTMLLGSRRVAAPAAPVSYKLTATVLVPTATLYTGMGSFFVYGGSGYPPFFLRARAA